MCNDKITNSNAHLQPKQKCNFVIKDFNNRKQQQRVNKKLTCAPLADALFKEK